jgi:hypothetical protein
MALASSVKIGFWRFAVMSKDSIWFMASGSRCCRFNFSGKLLEILDKLPSRDVGQNDSATHNPARFRRLVSDGLLKSDVCERYDDIAVYEADTGNLARE